MPLVAAFATSHAYTFQDPATWDERRERSKANVARKTGRPASDTPMALAETLAGNRARFAAIESAHRSIRERLAALAPDAVVLVGDDQMENYTADALPQMLVYVGGDYLADDWARGVNARVANDPGLALGLVEGCLDEGFDVCYARTFRDGKLVSHAHTEPTLYLVGADGPPVVPVFLNAVHPPVPSPARGYAFGRALRKVIDARFPGKRVVLGASGGLSHFSPSHPWAHHIGTRYVGDISVDFDERIVGRMRTGDGAALAALRTPELIEHGEGELLNWIVLLGATGAVRPDFLVYEPFYRAIMGMGAGWWALG